ncbi:MAG: hypothetical protein VXB01_06120 [Opitutae bacterium]
MADITPKDVLGSNYTATSTAITISLGDLLPAGELTAAEANATTGNGSKVAFALVKTLCEKLNALASADQPTAFTAYEGSFRTGSNDTLTRNYSMTWTFSEPTEIIDEPADSASSSSVSGS